jgi:hypothetical protein
MTTATATGKALAHRRRPSGQTDHRLRSRAGECHSGHSGSGYGGSGYGGSGYGSEGEDGGHPSINHAATAVREPPERRRRP